MYKLTENGVLRLADNAYIPNSMENNDWIEYQQWLSEGNTPDPQYTLEQYREIKKNNINGFRSNLLNKISSIVYTDNDITSVTESGIPWQADNESVRRINDAITLFSQTGSIPEGYVWRDYNDINRTVTLSNLVIIATAMSNRINTIFQYSWTLKTQLDLATTMVEIDAVIWDLDI